MTKKQPRGTTPRKRLTIYTDGACVRNPGPGGYAALLRSDSRQKIVSGGFRRTTNNRMELMAAIVALETLKKPCDVSVYSDSQYLVESMRNDSLARWQKAGWLRPDGQRVPNEDLWKRLSYVVKHHGVDFHWLPGHGESEENQICDALARDAARRSDLARDHFFEVEQRRKYAARGKTDRRRR